MNQDEVEVKEFFECLGEIWRDITAVEFLMRACIAKKDGEINKFPKSPYEKGKIYLDYPRSFSISHFEDLVTEFNKHFQNIQIPKEFANLRHAMAHGVIAEVDKDGVDRLVKFKKNKQNNLEIEFNMPLERKRMAQIRQSLREIRRYISKEADDNKK